MRSRTIIIGLLLALLAACGGPSSTEQTAVVEADTLRSTATAQAQATSTPTATPTPKPTNTPTPKPTPKPTNMPNPKPIATPKPAGLGSRDDLQTIFESDPFNFTFVEEVESDKPGINGQIAPPLTGIEIRLTGEKEVSEAQMRFTPKAGSIPGEAILLYMAAFLRVTAPSIDDPKEWVVEHLDIAVKEGTDVDIRDGRMISIISAPEADYMILSVLIMD